MYRPPGGPLFTKCTKTAELSKFSVFSLATVGKKKYNINKKGLVTLGANRRELNRQRTVADIEQAFLQLYQRDGIDGVSISAVCALSGVARSTFYLYFEDKYAVLQGVEDRLLSALWDICGNLPDLLAHRGGSENALRTIAHIRANIDWYRALLGRRGDPMFVYRWKRDIDRSLRRKLEQRNTGRQDADVQGVIFASALIGLYTYVIFEYPDIPDRDLCRYMDGLLAQILP